MTTPFPMPSWRIFICSLVTGILLAGCGGSSSESIGTPGPQTPPDTVSPVPSPVVSGPANKLWQTAAVIGKSRTSGDAQSPRIAFDPSGNALAVWVQYDPAPSNLRRIWSARYTAGGWEPAEIIQAVAADADYPAIAMDANGNALVVWAEWDSTVVYNVWSWRLWSRRYQAGTGWQAVEPVESVPGDAQAPRLAMDANGNAQVVWIQNYGTAYDVLSNRYMPGTGWGTAAQLNTYYWEAANAPQVAMDANGNAIAVWTQYDGVVDNHVWSNRFTAAGSGWGAARVIEAKSAGNANADAPQIAMDANGNAIAVWTQYDSATGYHLWSNRYTAGSGWGMASIEFTAANMGIPQIAMNASGNALVVWTQWDGTAAYNVWSRHYSTSGGWEPTIRPVQANQEDAEVPRIAMDANGNAQAVWIQNNGTAWDVWSNRYTAGTGWGTAQMIESNTDTADTPQIAVDANGNALGVWVQSDGVVKNIWANRFTN